MTEVDDLSSAFVSKRFEVLGETIPFLNAINLSRGGDDAQCGIRCSGGLPPWSA